MALDATVFNGATLKMERANRHVDEIQTELARFVEGGFYSIQSYSHQFLAAGGGALSRL